jgi:putative membrane protein
MKHRIGARERELIEEAVKAAERQSSAEIVTVIARSSDDYLFIPLLWAALGALFVPAVSMTFWPEFPMFQLYMVQLLLFLLLAMLGRVAPVRMWLIPPAVKSERAAKAARNHFLTLQLHRTQKRAAVMLFVSEAERYVEILTDAEVAEKIPDSEWEVAVQHFIARVKEGEITQGYYDAIGLSSELLSRYFPYDPEASDELPNGLIVI